MTEAAGRWDRVDGWLRRHPTVSDLALAAVLSAVLLPSSLPPVLASDWEPAAQVSMVAALVVLHAVVVVRRTHPVPAYALACTVMVTLLVPEVDAGVAPAGTVPAVLLPSALVFPVVLYAVSAHTRAPWPTSALAVGLVGAGLTTACCGTARARRPAGSRPSPVSPTCPPSSSRSAPPGRRWSCTRAGTRGDWATWVSSRHTGSCRRD